MSVLPRATKQPSGTIDPLGGPGRAASFQRATPLRAPKVLWQRLDSALSGGKYAGGLTLAGQTLFAAGDAFKGKRPATREWPKQVTLTALDAATGEQRWAFKATAESRAGGPVTVHEGVVLTATTLGMHAFDAATGKVKWFNTDETTLLSRPLALVDDVIVAPFADGLAGFDFATGKPRWKVKAAVFTQLTGPFASFDKLLFFTAEEPPKKDKRCRSVVALDVRGKAPKVVWKSPTFHKEDDSPIVADGRVVFWANPGRHPEIKLKSMDASSGKLEWEIGVENAGSGLAANGEVVCFGLSSGELCAVDAKHGRARWKSGWGGTPELSVGRCALGGGSLIAVRNEKQSVLVGLSVADGKRLWRLTAPKDHGAWAHWTPVLDAGVAYAQTLMGVVALK